MEALVALVIGVGCGIAYGRDETRAVTLVGSAFVLLSIAMLLGDYRFGIPCLALGLGMIAAMAFRVGRAPDGDEVASGHGSIGTALMVVAALVAACNVALGYFVLDSIGEPTDGSAILVFLALAIIGLTAGFGARALLARGGVRHRVSTMSLWTFPPTLVLLIVAGA